VERRARDCAGRYLSATHDPQPRGAPSLSHTMPIADEMFSANSTNLNITSPRASPGPAVATPPRSATPLQAAEKRKSDRTSNEEKMARRGSSDTARRSSAMGGSAVDADQLQKVLREFDDAGKARDTTPGGSPARKRQRVYGDRYEQIRGDRDYECNSNS
jgi:cell division cycle 20-like protein 1 (cofactor of APC complex)